MKLKKKKQAGMIVTMLRVFFHPVAPMFSLLIGFLVCASQEVREEYFVGVMAIFWILGGIYSYYLGKKYEF